ncbi:hypothetical protein evm_009073 [Chilo suppressalis]|nr:hypothetical protein evm_009073 [Chilo suppressalis]
MKEHVYSLCAGNSSADNVSYMAVNKFEDLPLCTGLIKSNLCEKRPAEEIQKSRTSSQDITIEKKSAPALQKKVKEECNKEKNNTGENSVAKIQHTLSEPLIKTELPSPKKTQSNGYSHKPDLKNVNKNQKGIAGFFNRGSNNTITKKSVNNIQENHSEKNHEEIRKSEKMEVDEEVRKHHNKKEDSSTSKSTKNLDQIKKTAKVNKKRKRVLQVSDSESENEKNDPFVDKSATEPESDDEIPPTPLINTVKITSGIVNPKKRRKIVDKTYTDEEGYILTKKEEVYESCSENEDINTKENNENVKVTPLKTIDAPPKDKKNINVNKNNKKKLSSPQKGKQATLMNFFKKV